MNLSVCAAPLKLATNERKVMAIRALAGAEPISALAARHGVSRPLVYRQMHRRGSKMAVLPLHRRAESSWVWRQN